MSRIAIIPARGGSKRIPGKNIRPFLGKPIIGYSIEAAIASGLFEEVMVSTDSLEIKKTAEEYGASVPFFRSPEASTDEATTFEVLYEVLTKYSKEKRNFLQGCCIYPTAPFITPDALTNALQLMTDKNFDSVFPVMRFGFPIQRALKIVEGKVEMFNPEHLNTRSQDLTPAYHDAGQFYWFSVQKALNERKIIGSNSGAIVLSELEGQDIDNLEDWTLAELKFSIAKDAAKKNQSKT